MIQFVLLKQLEFSHLPNLDLLVSICRVVTGVSPGLPDARFSTGSMFS
jgi:hypothetical protein